MNLVLSLPQLFLNAAPSAANFEHLSARLGDVLLASTWQGLLLTAGVAGVLRLWPELSAAARAALWTAVLVLVVALPALPLAMAGHGVQTCGGVLHLRETLSYGLVSLWAAVSAFRLTQLVLSALRLRGVLRRAEVVEPGPGLEPLLRSGRRRVGLCRSAEVDRPSLAGFFKPCVLFPPELLDELSDVELAQIVLHEVEHLRRGDDWVNLLQQISLVLLPLNPALLWLHRHLSLERERACDDRVLATTRARKAYAACLARVAESTLVRRSASLVLGVLGSFGGFGGFGARRPELVDRVERILRKPAAGMGRLQTRLTTGGLIAALLVCAVALAHSPRLVEFGPAPVTMAATAGDLIPATAKPQVAVVAPGVMLPNADARAPRMLATRATMGTQRVATGAFAAGSATPVRSLVFRNTVRQHGVRVRMRRRSPALRPGSRC